ncbi:hypothetical protein O5904_24325, partial [Escherichia coli]|nr:hypothetical protein [Escherichia coli]
IEFWLEHFEGIRLKDISEAKIYSAVSRMHNRKTKEIWINIRKIIKVKEGKSGWLFLDNDTHRSVDQFTGKKLISNTDLIKYMDFFSA